MAQNEINIKVKISDDGSLSLVSKKAKDAAKSTEELTQSRNRYQRGEKGVAGATSNSTKAFSKMQQAMGGGLVPAYATLAANVFALSAAFNVLRRAAQVEQLSAGLAVLGEASGLAMDTLSRGLQESTGYALSMEEAMRSTAMITSAGLDPSLIEDFGEAAKNASIALGRNTQDSLERFTRGVTKLEPELLDELGIFVKLDEAYDQYAQQLGKGVNQLTSFEKRQAFANATLAEAGEKFGALSEVDANPYDKLAAAFADLSKRFLTIVNSGVLPFLTLLLENTGLLIGSVAIFGSTISGRLIGSLESYAAGAAETAAQQRNLSKANIESLNSMNKSSKTLTALTKALEDGTVETEHFTAALKGQEMSMISNQKNIKKGDLLKYNTEKARSAAIVHEVRKAQLANALATATETQAQAMGSLQTGNYRLALTQLKLTFTQLSMSMRIATLQTGLLTKAFAMARVAGAMFAATAKTIGAAVAIAMGPLGIAISVIALLAEGIMFLIDKFKSEETKALEMAFEDATRAGKELDANFRNITAAAEGNSKTINTATQRYIALGNATSTTLQQLQKLESAAGSNAEVQREASQKQVEFLRDRVAASTELKAALAAEGITNINLGNLDKAKEVLGEVVVQGQQTASVKEALRNLNEETTRYFNTLSKTTPLDGMADGLGTLMNALAGTDDIKEINKIIDEGIGQAGRLRTLFEKAEGKTDKEKLANLTKIIQGEQERLRTAKDIIKQKELDLKVVQAADNLSTEGVKAVIAAEEDLRKEKLKNVEASLAYQEEQAKSVKGTEDEAQVQAEINRLRSERALLMAQEATQAENQLRIETQRHKNLQELQKSQKMILDFAQRQFDIAQAQDQLELQRMRRETALNAAKQGRSVSAAEAAKLAQAEADVLKSREEERINLRKQAIDLEYDLLASQFKLEEARIKRLLETEQITQDQYNNLMGSAGASGQAGSGILGAQSTVEGSRAAAQALAVEEEKAKTLEATNKAEIAAENAKRALRKQTLDFIQAEIDMMREKGRLQQALDGQEALNTAKLAQLKADLAKETDAENRISLQAQINELERENVNIAKERLGIAGETAIRLGAPEGMTNAVTAIAQDAEDPEGVMAKGTTSEKFAFLKEQTEGFMSDLAQLSPEGALMAAIGEGALAMGEAFSLVFEEMKSGSLSVQTAMQAVGATISAINQIQQAQANAAVSAIDKEIAAEKKRDGKSKESIAKIKKLEAQKDKIKRKAFEQDKKMKMAGVIMATAQAAMQAAAQPPGLPLTAPFVAMAIAMGAAQLAAIASTSYQGGGSAPSEGASTPATVSMGQRRTSTDLARSQGAAGELAYFRGARGIGGPENFRPAASGMKYRANGGNTAFMVGEQGPEMFIPERPGTIVPSDEVSQIGTPINANINISALDAEGVEDILMNQRGNIIGMLRDAANANGETFLESVSIQEV